MSKNWDTKQVDREFLHVIRCNQFTSSNECKQEIAYLINID